jgi:hypothetical protein
MKYKICTVKKHNNIFMEKHYYNDNLIKCITYMIYNSNKKILKCDKYNNNILESEEIYMFDNLNIYIKFKIFIIHKIYKKHKYMIRFTYSICSDINDLGKLLYMQYFKNGHLKTYIQYIDMYIKKEIKLKNGQIYSICYYKNGKLDGLCEFYFLNKYVYRNYINGKLNGFCFTYINNILSEEIFYINDKIIENIKY